ncbi:MAG: DUF2911 domain-containing protein [Bacteroidota bacterium]|nr:DUF2911 domain-containing protein [Bacteroidota bacterium]
MNKLLIFFLCLCSSILGAQIQTPAPSPLAKIDQKVGLGNIIIEYSRPSMKNRKIFGDLVPYNKLWRTGANMATKVTFSEDITVEGKSLAKGTYALYSIPTEDKWEIIFYADATQAGTPKTYDLTKEAVKVSVSSELLPYTFETFLIDVNEIKSDAATINLIWENTMVPIKLKFDVDAKVLKTIDKVLAGPASDDYYQAARYYYDNQKDMNVALGWIQKANAMEAKFWKLRMEALILAKLGRKTEAIEAAGKSKTMAIIEGNDEYVKMNDESIKEWSN